MACKIAELLNRFYYYLFDRLILYPMLYLLQNKCDISFMNLGYQPTDGEIQLPIVEKYIKESNVDRAHVYLYEKTLSLCPQYSSLNGMRILEVSCGHGGGINWIKKAHPEIGDIKGIDLVVTERAAGKIIKGDAHKIPFKDNSFDLILNIESSHLYRNISEFLNECSRVLQPNGYLCWADLRYRKEMRDLLEEAEQANLSLIDVIDITSQVLKGIEKTAVGYDAMLEQAPKIVRLFRNSIRTTYCAPGTESHRRLVEKEKTYSVACWKNSKEEITI